MKDTIKMNKMLFVLAMLLTLTTAGFAQKVVTHFLGIPVDGTKAEMVQKLKAKGFVKDPDVEDALRGQFNGTEVRLFIVMNRDKVWRIMLSDVHGQSAGDIKIRFNKLCQQFYNKKEYVPMFPEEDYTLSEDEDIAYEISVRDKRYEAGFCQFPPVRLADSVVVKEKIRPMLLQKYTEEQLANPTEEILREITQIVGKLAYDRISNCLVWFMIDELYGEYRINMFYDNEYNSADNGDDL